MRATTVDKTTEPKQLRAEKIKTISWKTIKSCVELKETAKSG